MALKDINIFEQHLEKIVLAVAGAGAAFMAYLALTPVSLPDHPEVHPKDVETQIADTVKQLDDGRIKRENSKVPNTEAGTTLLDTYREIASGNPLGKRSNYFPASDRVASVPEIGPHSIVPMYKGGTIREDYKAVVPDPAAPELVRAQVLQPMVTTGMPGVTADPQSGALPPPPAGQSYNATTHNVVEIEGWVPVGKMILQMAKEKDKARFVPDQLQRGVVYRVRVMRSELMPNGTWSKPELVTPAKGSPAPAEILTTAMADGDLINMLPSIDSQFQLIQLPTYYWDDKGLPVLAPILTSAVPESVVKEITSLHTDIQAAQSAAGGFVNAPGGGLAGTPGLGGPGMPGMMTGVVGPGGAATAPGVMLPSIAQIPTLEVQPFAFWDDSVKADHKYKYSVQVQLVNPGFGWRFGLANSALKIEPVIPVKDTGFVDVPGIVTVHSDLAFFIHGKDLERGIYGDLYKQINGRWFHGIFNADRGMNIQGGVSVAPGSTDDVDTKFTIVDYQESRSGVHVILRDPTGNLVSHDSDWGSQERQDLDKKVADSAAAAAAAATQPDMTGAGMMTPPPATPGRGGAPVMTPPAAPPATPTSRPKPVTGAPIR